jgi:uncharacterized membrane protein
MKVRMVVFFVLIALFTAEIVSAATIHGAVYNPSLTLIKNVQLEINTTPKQTQISKDGLFFFYVPPGNYKIVAIKQYNNTLIYLANKIIEIDKDGEYNIDVIAEPIPGVKIPDEDDSIPDIIFQKYGYVFYIVVIIAVILTALVLFLIIRLSIQKKKLTANNAKHEIKTIIGNIDTPLNIHPTEIETNLQVSTEKNAEETHKEEEKIPEQQTDLNEVLKIIKEEGGRTTQKDIRKKIPLSEAKVSLMISELEAKGKVEKIKKGRGNIIVLKN